jgi:hypothetical protein
MKAYASILNIKQHRRVTAGASYLESDRAFGSGGILDCDLDEPGTSERLPEVVLASNASLSPGIRLVPWPLLVIVAAAGPPKEYDVGLLSVVDGAATELLGLLASDGDFAM